MAKRKRYVLNLYARILQAIEDGRLTCLPVFSRSDRIGMEPTVVYVLRAGTVGMNTVTAMSVARKGKRRNESHRRSSLAALTVVDP